MKRLALSVLCSLVLLQGCAQSPLHPSDEDKAAKIYSDLGLAYLKQGNLDLALMKLERSLELDSNQPEAHHYIAEVYRQQDEIELAEEHYAEAVKLAPKDPMLLNNYGAFLCSQSRFDDAVKNFLQAASAKRYRTPELAYENVGLCAMRTKNYVTAEEYFRKALGMNSKLPKSLYQMAQINFDKKEFLRSRAFLQRFHDLSLPTEQSLKLGIQVETALGDEAAKAEFVNKLTTLFPHVDID